MEEETDVEEESGVTRESQPSNCWESTARLASYQEPACACLRIMTDGESGDRREGRGGRKGGEGKGNSGDWKE